MRMLLQRVTPPYPILYHEWYVVSKAIRVCRHAGCIQTKVLMIRRVSSGGTCAYTTTWHTRPLQGLPRILWMLAHAGSGTAYALLQCRSVGQVLHAQKVGYWLHRQRGT